MRYILLLLFVIINSCSLENFQASLGLGVAAKALVILVDHDTELSEEVYYIRIGDGVYKIIADKDVRSMVTFKCPECGMIFGMKPDESDLKIVPVLHCPRCGRGIAMLHDI